MDKNALKTMEGICGQRLTNVDMWNHVRSSENPADILLQGCSPEQLINADQ